MSSRTKTVKKSSTLSSTSGATVSVSSRLREQQVFLFLLVISFVLWVIYRFLFQFPVWFDEGVGKALFFGVPLWLYIVTTGDDSAVSTVRLAKFKPGLLMGLAIGGVFGFSTILLKLFTTGQMLQSAPVFMAEYFWWEFFLALLTSVWETLFFFSWIQNALDRHHPGWSGIKVALVTAVLFLVFHLPNTWLRFQGGDVSWQLGLLFLFALGQALVFFRRKNAYALILSQAIWGMVLLIHFT